MVDGSTARNIEAESKALPLQAERKEFAYNLELTQVLNSGRAGKSWYFWAGKRIFDIVFSLAALVVALPLFVLIALAIKWDTPGPVFFTQQRIGERLRVFAIFKFRTMVASNAPTLHRVIDLQTQTVRRPRLNEDPRITRVGRFLRRWSLDELPQLFNILLGDLSFVGPRPLCIEESLDANPAWLRRYSVPAGLTGLTQISMRGAVHSTETWSKDLEYIENLSLNQEIRILWRTVFVLKDDF